MFYPNRYLIHRIVLLSLTQNPRVTSYARVQEVVTRLRHNNAVLDPTLCANLYAFYLCIGKQSEVPWCHACMHPFKQLHLMA